MNHNVTCRFEWDMGHRLMNHKGKCANYHGHRYTLLATIGADTLNADGMVVDFDDIKPEIKGWIDEHLDHAMVLHVDDPLGAEMLKISNVLLLPHHPTAEHLVEMLATNISGLLVDFEEPPRRLRLTELVLYETPNCSATWRPQQRNPL